MDLIAARLHAIVKEAPLEECKKALKTMSLSQASQHLKNMYSTNLQRKEKIDNLANVFPDKDIETISKALEISNDDEEAALQYLLYHPPSLKENQKRRSDSMNEEVHEIKKPKIRVLPLSKGRLFPQINAKTQPKVSNSTTTSSITTDSAPFIYSRRTKRQPSIEEKKPEQKTKLYEFKSSEEDSSEYEEEEDFFESNGTPLKTEKIDLHGLVRKDARFLVESKIVHAKENGIGLYLFVCGKGIHSMNNVAVLKPMVLEICKKLNVNGYVSTVNPGIIICDVNRPYQQ